MIKISDAIQEIINSNYFFGFGIQNNIINLAKFARLIKPLVEARTKKDVSIQAIHMSISRLQKNIKRLPGIGIQHSFEIEKINIQGNLCVFSYERNSETHREINYIYRTIQKRGGYITILEGENEITTIFDKVCENEFIKKVGQKPKYTHKHVTSIGVSFNEKYLKIPGLLSVILQRISLQNINIIEIASTATEIIIYIHEQQAQLAFDTLYNSFLRKA